MTIYLCKKTRKVKKLRKKLEKKSGETVEIRGCISMCGACRKKAVAVMGKKGYAAKSAKKLAARLAEKATSPK